MLETGPRKTEQDIDTFRIVSGFDGNLPDKLLEGWKYEVSYNFGGRSARRSTRAISFDRISPRRSVRASSTPRPHSDVRDGDKPITDGCVPLNLLGGDGTITQDMIDWISYTGIARGYNREHTALGTVHGPLFKTPWDGTWYWPWVEITASSRPAPGRIPSRERQHNRNRPADRRSLRCGRGLLPELSIVP